MAQDYYKTLGVQRGASMEDIRKAYRELARKYHPDLHPDDASAKQKFQEIQAAFDVLNDPEKKDLYDRYGADFEAMGAGSGAGPGGAYHSWGPGAGGNAQQFDFDLEDLFGGAGPRGGASAGGGFADFFRQFGGNAGGRQGGGRRAQAAPQGADLQHEITVPFRTAVLGGEAQISVRRPEGEVETITVKIPAGIEDGKKIRLRGQGDAAIPNGPRGDLLITVRASKHPCYRRTGKRLDVVVPITLAEAVLGAKVDLPTPQGTITLTIPPGSSSGKKLRVKGHGVGAGTDNAGDLFAELQIVLPEDLSDEDRQAIAMVVAAYPDKPREELRW